MLMQQINLRGIAVDVILKDIKNVHLSVHPPTGRVRISAPLHMNLDTICVFAISKLDWIRRQQRKLQNQERETAREYLDGESHYLWGKRYLLEVLEKDAVPRVELKHSQILLQVCPGADRAKREAVLHNWYRQQLREQIPPLIAKWERETGVTVSEWRIKKMKTRWGTCNTHARRIWLNLELAKKSVSCLEYVLVHEMTHLLEHRHNCSTTIKTFG